VAQHPQPPLRIAIDLEMTGPKVGADAIIEIGAVRFIGDTRDGAPFQRLVQTEKPIPESIRQLTGITNSMLRGASTLDQALTDLLGYIGEAPLVGQNIAVDMAFLQAERPNLRNPLLDTYDLAVVVLPGLKNYTLEGLAAYLDVPAARFHRAQDDAETTWRVFLKLLARLQALDPSTREDLERLPASGTWTVGDLLKSFPHSAPETATTLSNLNLSAQLAAQQDINEGFYHLGGLGQQPSPPFQTSGEMATVVDRAQALVRPAVAQQTLRLLAEGGSLLLDLDNDRADLVSLLAPAARWAVDTSERVIISAPDSATMSYVAREIAPLAFAGAGFSRSQISVAELSEREAYLCVRRWFGGARASDGAEIARDVTRGLGRLVVWSRRTERGSRWELPLPLQEEPAWERSRAGVETRDSIHQCPYDAPGHCFLTAAQRAANAARIVVTTHKALAASLLAKDDLLPGATRVIALDPHALEETLRQTRTLALRYDYLSALLKDLSATTEDKRHIGLLHWAWQVFCPTDPIRARAWADEVAKAQAGANTFFSALHLIGLKFLPKPKERRTISVDEIRWDQGWRQVDRAWNDCRSALDGVTNLLRAIANEAEDQRPRASSELASAMVELLFTARQLDAVRDAGDELLAPAAPQFVTWIERPGDGDERAVTPRGRRISGTPVKYDTDLLGVHSRFGDAVRPLTMNGNGLALAGPGLAAGGDFAFSRRMFGLPDDTRGANFGRERSDQTLLCLPTDVPAPNEPGYKDKLNQALIRLAQELEGRLVVYFASRNSLKDGAQGIRYALERQGYRVLAQGIDGSAPAIWRKFSRERRAVLLGGGSFWNAGAEYMRRSCCIVIPRLPLPAPKADPVVAPRAEYWDQAHEQYYVPAAAQRMRVALARLAWSHEGRNAVVLFDRRSHTGYEGYAALASLPRCQELRASVDEIAREVSEWIGPAGG
jgi:DNA polymerase III epsilon subunit family exonuclease